MHFNAIYSYEFYVRVFTRYTHFLFGFVKHYVQTYSTIPP